MKQGSTEPHISGASGDWVETEVTALNQQEKQLAFQQDKNNKKNKDGEMPTHVLTSCGSQAAGTG